MNRFATFVIGIAFFGTSTAAFAQSASGSKLCVSIMQGSGGNTSPITSRDTLHKALEKQKNLKGTTEILNASTPEELSAEAKQKSCAFLLMTNLAEDHTESAYGPGVLMSTTIPTFFVTVDYKLEKISDGSEVSSGSAKAQDTGSQQNAVNISMNKIASKVGGALKGK